MAFKVSQRGHEPRQQKNVLPWNANFQLLLNNDKVGEYAQVNGRGGEENDQPEIELSFRPMISPPSLRNDFCCHFGLEGGPVESGNEA